MYTTLSIFVWNSLGDVGFKEYLMLRGWIGMDFACQNTKELDKVKGNGWKSKVEDAELT